MLRDTVFTDLDGSIAGILAPGLFPEGAEVQEYPERIREGVYLFGHLNPHLQMPLIRSQYWAGVCDDPFQWLHRFGPALERSTTFYTATFTRIAREEQPATEGWRWHKWGQYVGNQTPTTEYLYDEPEISAVYVFNIYEVEPE